MTFRDDASNDVLVPETIALIRQLMVMFPFLIWKPRTDNCSVIFYPHRNDYKVQYNMSCYTYAKESCVLKGRLRIHPNIVHLSISFT